MNVEILLIGYLSSFTHLDFALYLNQFTADGLPQSRHGRGGLNDDQLLALSFVVRNLSFLHQQWGPARQ